MLIYNAEPKTFSKL